jgi:hypothetical protein
MSPKAATLEGGEDDGIMALTVSKGRLDAHIAPSFAQCGDAGVHTAHIVQGLCEVGLNNIERRTQAYA